LDAAFAGIEHEQPTLCGIAVLLTTVLRPTTRALNAHASYQRLTLSLHASNQRLTLSLDASRVARFARFTFDANA
jgi:hypothetical protein